MLMIVTLQIQGFTVAMIWLKIKGKPSKNEKKTKEKGVYGRILKRITNYNKRRL